MIMIMMMIIRRPPVPGLRATAGLRAEAEADLGSLTVSALKEL